MPSEKLVKDLMRPLDQYYCVKEEETVKDALQFMGKAREQRKPPCLIVLENNPSKKEIIKGFITPTELVFGLATHFLKGAERNGPIFWEGQLETECIEGGKKRVGDIMIPIKGYVRDTEMLMEAVYLLNKYQGNFLPVVNQENVAGIIHLEDILKEISKIVLK